MIPPEETPLREFQYFGTEIHCFGHVLGQMTWIAKGSSMIPQKANHCRCVSRTPLRTHSVCFHVRKRNLSRVVSRCCVQIMNEGDRQLCIYLLSIQSGTARSKIVQICSRESEKEGVIITMNLLSIPTQTVRCSAERGAWETNAAELRDKEGLVS